MFEPVGLEFMYTNARSPQVMAKIDGLEALCTNVNCDYAYIDSPAVIYTQTYNPTTLVLSITGTALPTSGLSVSFGGATCGALASTSSPTLIEFVKLSSSIHN